MAVASTMVAWASVIVIVAEFLLMMTSIEIDHSHRQV